MRYENRHSKSLRATSQQAAASDRQCVASMVSANNCTNIMYVRVQKLLALRFGWLKKIWFSLSGTISAAKAANLRSLFTKVRGCSNNGQQPGLYSVRQSDLLAMVASFTRHFIYDYLKAFNFFMALFCGKYYFRLFLQLCVCVALLICFCFVVNICDFICVFCIMLRAYICGTLECVLYNAEARRSLTQQFPHWQHEPFSPSSYMCV